MAYQNEAQNISVGNVIGSVVNPLNWYLYNPGMYSWKKGIRVPGVKNIVDAVHNKKWNRVGEIWADKSKSKASRAWKILTGTTKNINPFGGGVWSGYGDTNKINQLNSIYNRRVNSLKNLRINSQIDFHASNMRIEASRMKALEPYINPKVSSFVKMLKGMDPHIDAMRINYIEEMVNGKAKRMYDEAKWNYHSSEYQLGVAKNKYENIKKSLGTGAEKAKLAVNSAKWGTRVAKFGVLAGKTVSFIGLASIAWDISKMVAEPLGRGIVGSVNSILNTYSERYNLDIGGKLSLGYLSQGAATERQRAIDAISRSHINGRSIMGSEASMMHY